MVILAGQSHSTSMQLTILTEQYKQVLMTTTNFHSGHQQQTLSKCQSDGGVYPLSLSKFSTGLNISIGHLEVMKPRIPGYTDENGSKSADLFGSKSLVKPSGLLDIVQKNAESPSARTQRPEPATNVTRVAKRRAMDLAEDICTKCHKPSRSLCRCEVSNQALSRLYRFYAGFNTPMASSAETSDSFEVTTWTRTQTPAEEKTFQIL